jgi:hypothetical protein
MSPLPAEKLGLPWEEDGWLERSTVWIDAHVDRTGEVALLRTRPWAAVARVPTAEGLLWFKDNPAGNAFEPALTALLAGLRPDALPEVVAHEGPRLLTRDVGARLRDLLDANEPAPSWEVVLAQYGELHAAFTSVAEQALALGAPDERPERLRPAFGHAYLLAPIGRAQVWHRILGPLAGEVSSAHGDPVSAWIEILGGIASGDVLLGAA